MQQISLRKLSKISFLMRSEGQATEFPPLVRTSCFLVTEQNTDAFPALNFLLQLLSAHIFLIGNFSYKHQQTISS